MTARGFPIFALAAFIVVVVGGGVFSSSPPPTLPAADPVIAPLTFMTGTWVAEQARRAVIEEQ